MMMFACDKYGLVVELDTGYRLRAPPAHRNDRAWLAPLIENHLAGLNVLEEHPSLRSGNGGIPGQRHARLRATRLGGLRASLVQRRDLCFGSAGSWRKLRVDHIGVFHLLRISDVVAHAWKRHGLPAATAVLEAKKIGRDEGFPHYRPSGVAWSGSPGRRPPSRKTHFMGVRVARSVRLPLATADAGRWARIGLRQPQTHSVRPTTGCVGRRLA